MLIDDEIRRRRRRRRQRRRQRRCCSWNGEEYDDDDDDDDVTLGSEDTIENGDEDDEDKCCSLEYIEKTLKEKNITYTNLLSILLYRFPENTTTRNKRKLEKEIYHTVRELDLQTSNEHSETEMMNAEDEYMKNLKERELEQSENIQMNKEDVNM